VRKTGRHGHDDCDSDAMTILRFVDWRDAFVYDCHSFRIISAWNAVKVAEWMLASGFLAETPGAMVGPFHVCFSAVFLSVSILLQKCQFTSQGSYIL
jgi:hypothetical protein